MNNFIFGRYTNYDTIIHRIEPRLKMFLLVLLIVPIFFSFKVWSTNLIMIVLLVIVFFLVVGLSKTSIRQLLKSLASMWFLVLFLLVIYVFVPNSSYEMVAFYIGNYAIYWDSFYQCGHIVIRLFLLVSIMMVLTTTTKNTDMTYAFEWYMAPLKVFKFPSHAVAMTLSIALRFVPTLIEEANRILKAQESRGLDFNHGGIGRRFTAIIALIIPLFNSAFTRSDELAHAMEARGYDPMAKRSRYRKYNLHMVDLWSTILVVVIFAGYLTLFILDRNQVFSTGNFDIIKIFFNVDIGW